MDTPGFSSLYVNDFEKEELKYYFREFASYEGQCRFQGCDHVHEPGCAVKEALEEGKIHPVRYKNYLEMYSEHPIYLISKTGDISLPPMTITFSLKSSPLCREVLAVGTTSLNALSTTFSFNSGRSEYHFVSLSLHYGNGILYLQNRAGREQICFPNNKKIYGKWYRKEYEKGR